MEGHGADEAHEIGPGFATNAGESNTAASTTSAADQNASSSGQEPSDRSNADSNPSLDNSDRDPAATDDADSSSDDRSTDNNQSDNDNTDGTGDVDDAGENDSDGTGDGTDDNGTGDSGDGTDDSDSSDNTDDTNNGADDNDDVDDSSDSESLTHKAACVSRDSIETIRDNLLTDSSAYATCIRERCPKTFQLRSRGISIYEGELADTDIGRLLEPFDEEDDAVDFEAVLYDIDEDGLHFMNMKSPDELILPMHTGVHYSPGDENTFFGDKFEENEDVEEFTNFSGVPATLPFGVLNGYFGPSYGYQKDSAADSPHVKFAFNGCDLYEKVTDSGEGEDGEEGMTAGDEEENADDNADDSVVDLDAETVEDGSDADAVEDGLDTEAIEDDSDANALDAEAIEDDSDADAVEDGLDAEAIEDDSDADAVADGLDLAGVEYREVPLFEDVLAYDAPYHTSGDEPEPEYAETRFFFPNETDLKVETKGDNVAEADGEGDTAVGDDGEDDNVTEADGEGVTEVGSENDSEDESEDESEAAYRLRKAILDGEKCWLSSLPPKPDTEEEIDQWKEQFLYQTKGKVKSTDMKTKLPTRFYFIVQ